MAENNKLYWSGLIKKSSGKLDLVERINEVIFGLIMVLTFTCTISAANQGREEVGTVLWAALGCNVAWGIIDAFIYLFTVMLYRGESLNTLQQIQKAGSNEEANELIRDALPPLMHELMKEEHYDYFRSEIKKLPEAPEKTVITWNDLMGAVKIFLLVFISTFPVTIPFIFIKDVFIATRISNGIALVLRPIVRFHVFPEIFFF